MRELVPPLPVGRTLASIGLAAALAAPASPLTPPPPTAAPTGPEITVAVESASPHVAPAVAMLHGGGFAVAWADPSGQLLLRVFGGDDEPRGPVEVVGGGLAPAPGSSSLGLDLAVLVDGSLVVVWTQEDASCDPPVDCKPTVLARHFTNDGTPLSASYPVADLPGPQRDPHVAAMPGFTDGFVVAFTLESSYPGEVDPAGVGDDVVARRFVSRELPLGEPILVNELGPKDRRTGGVAAGTTGFVVVWQSWEGEATGLDVYRRRFGLLGEPLEDELQVNDPAVAAGPQSEPDVAMLLGGGHVVAWTEGDSSGAGGSIVARIYDAEAVPISEELLVQEGADGHQHAPAIAAASDDWVVTWTDSCPPDSCATAPHGKDGSGSGVFTSYISSLFGWGVLALELPLAISTDGEQGGSAVDGRDNRWVAVWLDRPDDAAPAASVRARRIGYPAAGSGECPAGALCLAGGTAADSFSVGVTWQDRDGVFHDAVATRRGADWGTFWFFGPHNVEVAVKILDGRPVNGAFWVFAASLTDLRYVLRVTDNATGRALSWNNPPGTMMSRADTGTLVDAPASGAPVRGSSVGARAGITGVVAGDGLVAPAGAPAPAGGLVAFEPGGAAVAAPATIGPCAPDEVCVGGDRFRVEASWTNFSGNQGAAGGGLLGSDTAWLWFFTPGNPELLVKVLDGTALNGHYWVFFASLSSVTFDLTVTDRVTGTKATYHNPAGTLASRADVRALAP